MVLYLLNALVTPFKGVTAEFRIERVTKNTAKEIFEINKNRVVSALGHEGAVQAFQILLGEHPEIKINRIQVFLERGDEALALSLKARIPEGKVLTLEEMENIGYDIYYVKRTM